jgi:hypothetical protein
VKGLGVGEAAVDVEHSIISFIATTIDDAGMDELACGSVRQRHDELRVAGCE